MNEEDRALISELNENVASLLALLRKYAPVIEKFTSNPLMRIGRR